MALLIKGSAKMRSNTNPSTPANAPASTPRRMTRISTAASAPYRGLSRGLVAGEPKEVPRVMHPLVDEHRLAEQGCHPLVDAHEVVDGQRREHRNPDNQGHPAAGQRLGRETDVRNRVAAGLGEDCHGCLLQGSCVPCLMGKTRRRSI